MVQEIDGERYFTIKEAAVLLGRHRLTVWRWTAERKIEFHQPFAGAIILIPQHVITSLKKTL
jgi:excisionase family DNA binding protein